MTQRGPGFNTRQTQSSTEPDKSPKGSSPGSCPTHNPSPSRSNGRRRRGPAAVHVQCTRAQMLWQIRNTSLAVAAPRQPIGTHACRACLPGPGAYRHADRLRLDERYGDRCQIAAKIHRAMRWRAMYRGVRTYVKHALRALS